MELISDILLASGALGAGFYCFILGRRLNRFNDLKEGVGGAVAVLSAQVDDLTRTLNAAQSAAGGSARILTDLTQRAEDTARQLELQMAALHDIPIEPVSAKAQTGTSTVGPRTGQPTEPMFMRRHDTQGAS